MKHHLLTFLSICCIALTTAATAQDMGLPSEFPLKKSYEVTLGLGLSNRPAYLGSDDRKTAALPIIAARWSNGWFAGTTTGIGYQVPSSGPFRVGLRMGFDLGRKEGDSPDLKGMGDIPMRHTFGAFASYRLSPQVALGSNLNFGTGRDREGMRLDLSVRSQMMLAPQHRIFGSAGLTFANQAAMQSQFGVTASQSASSGYSLYTPSAGLRDINLNLGYGYAINQNASMLLGLNVRSLQGDAKSSPLTRSATGGSINFGLAYTLD
jgi:MipA family protein